MEELRKQEQPPKQIHLADNTLIGVDDILSMVDMESTELSPYQAMPYMM